MKQKVFIGGGQSARRNYFPVVILEELGKKEGGL